MILIKYLSHTQIMLLGLRHLLHCEQLAALFGFNLPDLPEPPFSNHIMKREVALVHVRLEHALLLIDRLHQRLLEQLLQLLKIIPSAVQLNAVLLRQLSLLLVLNQLMLTQPFRENRALI